MIFRWPNGRSIFKNTGRADTPILENLQALDAMFERGAEGEFVLHGNKGDWCVPQSYEPYQITLGPGSSTQLRARRRTSDQRSQGMALFQSPNARRRLHLRHRLAGPMGVLHSCATRRRGLRVIAGQQVTHLYLKPGE